MYVRLSGTNKNIHIFIRRGSRNFRQGGSNFPKIFDKLKKKKKKKNKKKKKKKKKKKRGGGEKREENGGFW